MVDDIELIQTLHNSKVIEDETKIQIESQKQAIAKIEIARENYKPLAVTASKIFFIINDFSLLDNMY